jgi:hypothetical protein
VSDSETGNGTIEKRIALPRVISSGKRQDLAAGESYGTALERDIWDMFTMVVKNSAWTWQRLSPPLARASPSSRQACDICAKGRRGWSASSPS